MDMVELIGGIIVGGVAGVALKDKIMGANSQTDNKQKELDSLYAENEKLSKRNKDLERQVEDLLSELNKVRKKAKDSDDDQEDLQDELDKSKGNLKTFVCKMTNLLANLKNTNLHVKHKRQKSQC